MNNSIKSCVDYSKWSFMMNWCKNNGLSPADEHNWKKAEEAHNKILENPKCEE
jgi:hypothetical protein